MCIFGNSLFVKFLDLPSYLRSAVSLYYRIRDLRASITLPLTLGLRVKNKGMYRVIGERREDGLDAE